MIIKIIISISVILLSLLFPDEYDFDVSEFEKKPFEFSGTAEFRPSLIIPEKKSLSWRLKYFDTTNSRKVLDNYLLLALPVAKFEKKGVLLYASTDARIGYNHPEKKWDFGITLLEGYGKYQFNPRWSILLGKKLYKWGKGYIYNPVSYAGRQKNVNDVDASLEGFYTAGVEYVKSFSSKVFKNISQELVFIPVYKKLNDDYCTGDRHWLVSRTYFLIYNTDFELFLNIAEDFDYKIGLAAAHNILANWEIHGELSYLPDIVKPLVSDNGYPQLHSKKNAIQSIAGTRYLAPFNATFYLEYIYNGAGLTDTEMASWYAVVHNALDAQNTQTLGRLRKQWFGSLNRQFFMNHYLYFKMQYPEPFNFLYFTPSVYLLMNLSDKSLLSGLDMNYKRFNRVSFNLKLVGLYGKTDSEYGSKISEVKTELRVKYFF